MAQVRAERGRHGWQVGGAAGLYKKRDKHIQATEAWRLEAVDPNL